MHGDQSFNNYVITFYVTYLNTIISPRTILDANKKMVIKVLALNPLTAGAAYIRVSLFC